MDPHMLNCLKHMIADSGTLLPFIVENSAELHL